MEAVELLELIWAELLELLELILAELLELLLVEGTELVGKSEAKANSCVDSFLMFTEEVKTRSDVVSELMEAVELLELIWAELLELLELILAELLELLELILAELL